MFVQLQSKIEINKKIKWKMSIKNVFITHVSAQLWEFGEIVHLYRIFTGKLIGAIRIPVISNDFMGC